jgi:alanyl-tRNA synthetase
MLELTVKVVVLTTIVYPNVHLTNVVDLRQEIHYDRIGNRDAATLVNADRPDVIEIWNNVFIQYNREADGSLRELPAQHVDTGMGFERLTSILQGVDSNYDTDIFMPLFEEIQKVTGAPPYGGRIGSDDVGYVDTAYRVVADHVRTLSFAIADGAVPSNDGRGYVLRRVLRRAVRYGRQNLGADLGFFCRLVPKLVSVMGEAFPELVEKQNHVMAIIREEEESFSRTLDKGLQKFQELADRQPSGTDGAAVFSGDDAHFLYTTMGFPVDLTELMAQERGMGVDKAGFEARMKHEQELSAAAHKAKMASGSGKDMDLQAEQTAHLASLSIPGTDDAAKYVCNQDLTGCVVQALFLGRNETQDKIGFVDAVGTESSTVGFVLDKTSFYAEAGGQIFDTGLLESSSATVRVTNVQQYGQYILHVGNVESGAVKVGDSITCRVDYVRRAPIASNHTMTHVLNYALREVLVCRPERDSPGGTTTQSVDQKGSLVDEAKLRFDFSWNSQLTPEQLAAVEQLCVERIEQEVPVDAYVAPLPQAEQISSLRAVFGEKYPDPVRVVSVAAVKVTDMLSNPQDATWNQYSVEFCGGTHLTNTKEAEAFCLLSEEGIAKGIRRIVAVTRDDAKRAIALATEFDSKMKFAERLGGGDELESQIKVLTSELNSIDISAVKKIAFREGLAGFGKMVIAYKKQKMAGMADEIVEKAVQDAEGTPGNKVVLRFDFGLDGKLGKSILTSVNKKVTDKAVMLVSADEDADRFLVFAASPKGVEVDCKAWAEAATQGTDAKGGGKKDNVLLNAQGVGSIESVLRKARQF